MTARRTRWLTVIALTMSACIVVPTPAGADTADRGGSRGGGGFSAGAPGAGDDYFPFAGNGGFDVKHDDLERQARRPGAEVPSADRLSGGPAQPAAGNSVRPDACQARIPPSSSMTSAYPSARSSRPATALMFPLMQ
jgi:hypothetical protein